MNIRLALQIEISTIQAIERKAAGLFSEFDLPEHLRCEVTSAETLAVGIESENLLIAVDSHNVATGFTLASPARNMLHLEEVSVLPEHGRRGIGRLLVRPVLSTAKQRNCAGVTLTTFAHVFWNGPFYASCGFAELNESEMDDHQRSRLQHEEQLGLRNRIGMAARC